jgi:hypothetical protein
MPKPKNPRESEAVMSDNGATIHRFTVSDEFRTYGYPQGRFAVWVWDDGTVELMFDPSPYGGTFLPPMLSWADDAERQE